MLSIRLGWLLFTLLGIFMFPHGVAASSGNVLKADNGISALSGSSTEIPTTAPSCTPGASPTFVPSTAIPSMQPTYYPSLSPHTISIISTIADIPTATPSIQPEYPTLVPSSSPPTTSTPSSNYPSQSPSIGIITTIAGTGSGTYSGDNGQATAAGLYNPEGVALDAAGNVYIGDYNNNRIRKVTISTGIITTIAGTGTTTYSGNNGPATSATLWYPAGVALDSAGNIYIADSNNSRIRKVTVSTGIISTIAGKGFYGNYSGDNGAATSATLRYPYGVGLDTAGNVYIADTLNQRIRKVTISTGIITTFAGTGTTSYSGDNGPATSATLNVPIGVTVDSAGNIYIADYYNQRIRKVTVSTGIINTIAGTGTTSYSGDNGPATSATLNRPYGVAVDSSGNVYIADSNNNRIRKVTVSTGIITTIAGSSTSGSYSGDNGPATSATLNQPSGVALDASGNIYIVDRYNNVIRLVNNVTVVSTFAPTVSPTNALDVSIFENHAVSSRVAEEKFRAYLGSFIGYFAALYVLLYTFRRTKYGQLTVALLHNSAFSSSNHKRYSVSITPPESVENVAELRNIYDGNQVLAAIPEEENEHITRISSTEVHDTKVYRSERYISYCNQRRYLLGCGPILYPAGYELNLWFTRVVMPPGYMENLMLYLCNNHQFFNCIYYIEHKKVFGSRGRILVYVVKEGVVFVLTQFLSGLVEHYSINHFTYLAPLIKVFVITPISIMVGLALLYMYTVPCTETNDNIKSNDHLKCCIRLLSRGFIVPVVVIMSASLVVACLLTTGDRVPYILLNFFFTVQLWSILLQILHAVAGFYDNHYFHRVYLLGKTMYSIGDIFLERIVADNQVLGVDYVVTQSRYFGLVSTTTIIGKSGLLADKNRNLSIDSPNKVEMTVREQVIDITDVNNDYFDANIVVTNPIISTAAVVRLD